MKFVSALLMALLSLDGTAHAGDVSGAMFHGGPTHTGTMTGDGPDGFFAPLWRFNAGHMIVG